MRDDFRKRWKIEYLHELQVLTKWKQLKPSVQVDYMVVIKEDSAPPAKWMIGRVVQTFLDKEGIVRWLTRPIHKLVLLPVNKEP